MRVRRLRPDGLAMQDVICQKRRVVTISPNPSPLFTSLLSSSPSSHPFLLQNSSPCIGIGATWGWIPQVLSQLSSRYALLLFLLGLMHSGYCLIDFSVDLCMFVFFWYFYFIPCLNKKILGTCGVRGVVWLFLYILCRLGV